MTNDKNCSDDRVGRYLRGELSRKDTEELEVDMFNDETVFNEVIFQSMLKKGMRISIINNDLKDLSVARRFKFLTIQNGVSFLLILLLGVQSWNNNLMQQELLNLSAPEIEVPIVSLELNTRSSRKESSGKHILITSAKSVLLRVDVSSWYLDEYMVNLKIKNESEYKWRRVAPDKYGYITIKLAKEEGSIMDVTIEVANSGDETLFAHYIVIKDN
ncbi:MAG: hypothetical protein Tsb002_05490 [Wenzhouxiangellaceae bacterium]